MKPGTFFIFLTGLAMLMNPGCKHGCRLWPSI